MRNAKLLCVIVLVPVLGGCGRSPQEIREWQPADHDNDDAIANATQLPSQRTAAANAKSSAAGNPTMESRSAWNDLCARCHGTLAADGRLGSPSPDTRNLSDPVWQGAVSDLQIAAAITQGKGRMPAFSLEPAATQRLVALIRSFGKGSP